MLHRFIGYPLACAVTVASCLACTPNASAQVAVSANDGKQRLVDGKTVVNKDGVDTVMLIDLGASPPRSLAEIKVPASVAGPPTSVAVAPNEAFALVTAATKHDPSDSSKLVPNDVVTIIDFNKTGGVVSNVTARLRGKSAPPQYQPKVMGTVHTGKGPSGISINRAGTLALVANRAEGTVSVLEIKGKAVTVLPDKITLGNDKSGPSAVAFTPDGKMALVTRDGDNKISVLSIDGTRVTDTKREISAGLRPYGLDIAPKGDVAVVANIGTGSGDSDTISLIDLVAKPPRVVTTLSVGQTPEGVKFSPDGNYIAVSVMNGTNKAEGNPFHNKRGKLVVIRRNGRDLTRVADANVGVWCQGIAWSANSRKLLVQCAGDELISAYNWSGQTQTLTLAGTIKTQGAPAGIRTVEK